MGAPEIVEAYREAGIALCAVTDHNASDNVMAVAGAAQGIPVVLPGMEVQTAEDIHIVVISPAFLRPGIFRPGSGRKCLPWQTVPKYSEIS